MSVYTDEMRIHGEIPTTHRDRVSEYTGRYSRDRIDSILGSSTVLKRVGGFMIMDETMRSEEGFTGCPGERGFHRWKVLGSPLKV